MDDDFLLLLLADSNLPTGSFVASSGLESFTTHGFLHDILPFIHDSLHSYAHTALPVVSDAHRIVAEPVGDPFAALVALDAFYDSITLNHVARRASTAQGVALLTLYSRAFAPPDPSPMSLLVDQLKLAVRRGDTHGHLPLCWGVLTGALNLSLDRAQHLALFLHARSLLSAAVRMNTIGPYLSQQLLLRDIRPMVDAFVTQCSTISTNREDADRPANTWPLADPYFYIQYFKLASPAGSVHQCEIHRGDDVASTTLCCTRRILLFTHILDDTHLVKGASVFEILADD